MNELKRQCDVGLFIRDEKLHIYDSIDEAISAYNQANQIAQIVGTTAPKQPATAV